jgi:hypothetical protein
VSIAEPAHCGRTAAIHGRACPPIAPHASAGAPGVDDLLTELPDGPTPTASYTCTQRNSVDPPNQLEFSVDPL